MNNQQLLALPFATKRHSYLYDVVTNRIFFAPEPTYLILQRYRHNTRQEIEADLAISFGQDVVQTAYDRVAHYVERERAFFRQPLWVKPLSEEDYWDLLFRRHGCGQLVLNITHGCNLRCRYCIFSGEYAHYRAHSSAAMRFPVAKAAIDYYWQLQKRTYLPGKSNFINFYGGEPLLRFKFIKQCVDYARSLEDEDVQFVFGLTTNGTLVTEDKVDFFLQQQFNLVFSLDGPRSEHDRNRVHLNGKGSFDEVLQSLEMIRQKDPQYYQQNVMISTVYDHNTDLIAVNSFFVEHKDLLPPGGIVALQRHNNTGEPSRTQASTNLLTQETELLRRYRLGKLNAERCETGFLERLGIGIRLLANRDYARMDGNSIEHFTGRCLPGTKIAVQPDGTFHICERINESFPIGDCESGLDFKRIQYVINLYDDQVTQHCSSCLVQRFCSVCFAQACVQDDFDASPICNDLPDLVKAQLSYLCSILSTNKQNLMDEASRIN
jgi:uncharacterized protein